MARRYDQSTTTFSPEGRLHQVEYAIERINNAGTCVGLQAADGIVLAAEKRVVSKLLAPSKECEKTYPIDDHCAALVAGFTADANILIQQSQLDAQRHLYKYQVAMPVEQLVKAICNYKQSYTQYGGLRPFGVAFLFGGWDKHFGFQLYQTDPSGNYSGWKATVIGQNNQAGKSLLKTDYTAETATLDKNLKLAVKILLKTMDANAPTPDRFEITTLKVIDPDSGSVSNLMDNIRHDVKQVVKTTLTEGEIEALIKEVQAEEEAEQKQATSTTGDI